VSRFALHLMRHGEPVLAGTMLGHTDGAATPAGVRACREAGAGLAGVRLIASDLIRARACAEALGPAETDPRWRELDFGEWDGRRANELDPHALGRFWDDPDAHPPPGGERWSALLARVGAALDALAPVPTLVVTHAGAMRAALCRLCEFDRHQAWAFDLPYACLLSLEMWEGAPRLARVTGLRA